MHRAIGQESIQSSTTPDPGYQWESDKLTVIHPFESQEVSPFPADDHKEKINRPPQIQQTTFSNLYFGGILRVN